MNGTGPKISPVPSSLSTHQFRKGLVGPVCRVKREGHDNHVPPFALRGFRHPHKLKTGFLRRPAPFDHSITMTAGSNRVLISIPASAYFRHDMVKGDLFPAAPMFDLVPVPIPVPVLATEIIPAEHSLFRPGDILGLDLNPGKAVQACHQGHGNDRGAPVILDPGPYDSGLIGFEDFDLSPVHEPDGIFDGTFAPVGIVSGENNNGGHTRNPILSIV